MQTRARWVIGMVAVVSALGLTTPAFSDEIRGHHGRSGGEQWRHRDDFRRHRDDFRRHRDGRAPYRWQRHEGWRHEGWRREADRHHGRHDWDRHRPAATWRFDRHHGWRFERAPGVWSPGFVWWRLEGRPILRPLPTVRIVRYPTGYYELVGDGITVPYYWLWRPTVVVATPPPPLPLPPPLPGEYPYPPDAYYPPPPQG